MSNRFGFRKELESLINRMSIDSECQTPDFILADMVAGFLKTYQQTLRTREKWYGRPDPKEPQSLEDQKTLIDYKKEAEHLRNILSQCNRHVIPGEIDTVGGYVIELEAAHKKINELQKELLDLRCKLSNGIG